MEVGLKFVGVGLMAIAMGLSALSVGWIFSSLLNAISRNPNIIDQAQKNAFVGAGLAEAPGLFGFMIAIVLII